MPLGSPSDLAFMLRDAGDAAVFNGVTLYGILEISDAVEGTEQGGVVQVRVTTFLIATDAVTALRISGRITVLGVPYRIDRQSPEDDGETTRLYLSRAS